MFISVGTTERRIWAVLLLSSFLSLIAALGLSSYLVRGELAAVPASSQTLGESLDVYYALAKWVQRSFRSEGRVIALDPPLRRAVAAADNAAMQRRLGQLQTLLPAVYSLRIEGDAEAITTRRAKPFDAAQEHRYVVRSQLGAKAWLVVTFVTSRSRIDRLSLVRSKWTRWKRFEEQRSGGPLALVGRHGFAFLVLSLASFAWMLLLGRALVVPMARRMREIVAVTEAVAQGDLAVRLSEDSAAPPERLARAFNHMLEQLEQSRARVEFLRRIGQWQTIARRLAHEIKNPLTPIQLAVEECFNRYDGGDTSFGMLLSETHDIVIEEVASLRRLVGEFAAFARMPRATLKQGGLRAYLEEIRPRLEREVPPELERPVRFELELCDAAMPIVLDHTMLYRSLANLVVNAAQAAAASVGQSEGLVRLSTAMDGSWCCMMVDDNGLGIPAALEESVFDPYMTTKRDGTGLGLTIVKKVVMDHGGDIVAGRSPLGGARFTIRIPPAGSQASQLALSQSLLAPVSG